ncbi:peptidoglycan DD-metalloendopeptidase family protein [Prosthecochloris sp. N3]|uniref:Peptidoglycan DD-metalloendopeptidase family protein n=1 Tax=Prosthecochloris ethylica TaxID=2743976 RepID=A0ABR9XRH6_9CHLB|nr:peptidoglycan DD-metalloendopeptidase family protein [Prosthecochloris ethylica]MBF0586725.1 peptidoglycan DD-metalloendopeptidase family protein [Prosthecochloris ethylica]MBF0636631.1 peptidoglycan DD-metalloendopeptidase family protein [Prosthecochloris ethylica]NUK47970.1 peptidoglycan DD-metalloendopeptidase family protein [Prosthecochloris ethylica]
MLNVVRVSVLRKVAVLAAGMLVLLAVAVAVPAGAAPPLNEEIEKILEERKKLEENAGSLKKQLAEYQKKLKDANLKEKQSLDAVKNFTAQITLLNKLIEKNDARLKVQDQQIRLLKRQLEDNRSRHERIADEFREVAVSVYKHGADRDIELLFASTSLNQAIVRSRYIGFFSSAVASVVTDLEQTAKELEESRSRLQKSYREREGMLREQKGKMQSVAEKKKEKEVAIDKLKKNKKKFTEEIQSNRKKLKQLQAKIEELIKAEQVAVEKERERLRREAERRRLAGEAPLVDVAAQELAAVSVDFDKAAGLLQWPVKNGTVIRKFGNNRDPDLNIVTTNNGIDISVPVGSPVRAVSGGVVSQVTYMPTFGNIVLLRHANSYLTVYANLAKISVARNDLVFGNEVIGSTGPMPEGGSLLHFELWKGREKLNPEQWLKK